MLFLRRIFLLLSVWLSSVLALSATGQNVLVVLESKLKKEDYSTFFSGLEKRGYKLTFREPKSTSPQVVQDGVTMFDQLIFFAPSTKTFTTDLSPQNVISLIERGVNVLVALGPTHTPLSSLAAEFGLILPPPQTPLISHFTHLEGKDPSYIVIPFPKDNIFLPSAPRKTHIVFKGISTAYTPNPALFPILRAPVESYATDADFSSDKGADAIAASIEKGGEGLWAGSSMGIITGFIARNGARVVFTGGVDMFSDEFAEFKIHGIRSGNPALAQDLTAWNFQEHMVLRVRKVHHYLESTKNQSSTAIPPPQEQYTINDRITYTIELQTFSPRDGKWYPFYLPETAPANELQISFVMLDPHIRTSLTAITSQPGLYTTTFRAPDRHGVFKFHFQYLRKGFTPLEHSVTVPLVPPRHDGYPRFLSSAWPYYAGAISTSAGFLVFAALWLGSAGAEGRDKGKKKE